jgi:hypothetical protein
MNMFAEYLTWKARPRPSALCDNDCACRLHEWLDSRGEERCAICLRACASNSSLFVGFCRRSQAYHCARYSVCAAKACEAVLSAPILAPLAHHS